MLSSEADVLDIWVFFIKKKRGFYGHTLIKELMFMCA